MYLLEIQLEREKLFWGDDEESKRTGTMPNGMPTPPRFWDMSAEERDEFTTFASWMNLLNPSITLEELIGGGASPGGGSVGGSRQKMSYYDAYEKLLPYYRTARTAASNHDIDERALTAVLLWEMQTRAHKLGNATLIADFLAGIAKDSKNPKNKEHGASAGFAQLEIYKIKILFEKETGKKFESQAGRDYLEKALGANRSIHLAASWMKHLKQNVWYMKGGTKHYLNDIEAAIAYCGCSGVTVDNPASGNTKINSDKFRTWAESVFKDNMLQLTNSESRATGIERNDNAPVAGTRQRRRRILGVQQNRLGQVRLTVARTARTRPIRLVAAVLGLLTVATGCLQPSASVTLRVDPAALEDVRSIGRVRAEFAHESDTEGGGTQISETMIIDVGGMNAREALDRAANLLAARDWMIEAENRPTIIGMASTRWKDTSLDLRPYHPAYFEDHPEVLEKIKKESVDSSSLVYLDVSSLNVSPS